MQLVRALQLEAPCSLTTVWTRSPPATHGSGDRPRLPHLLRTVPPPSPPAAFAANCASFIPTCRICCELCLLRSHLPHLLRTVPPPSPPAAFAANCASFILTCCICCELCLLHPHLLHLLRTVPPPSPPAAFAANCASFIPTCRIRCELCLLRSHLPHLLRTVPPSSPPAAFAANCASSIPTCRICCELCLLHSHLLHLLRTVPPSSPPAAFLLRTVPLYLIAHTLGNGYRMRLAPLFANHASPHGNAMCIDRTLLAGFEFPVTQPPLCWKAITSHRLRLRRYATAGGNGRTCQAAGFQAMFDQQLSEPRTDGKVPSARFSVNIQLDGVYLSLAA